MQLYADITASVTARHIQTPMSQIAGCLPRDSAVETAARLAVSNFDFEAVVVEGRVIGRVAASGLAAVDRVGEAMQSLDSSYLVSSSSPVARVMRWLAKDPWLLVVDHNQLPGLVTPSDLNRQPARTYFYLLLADLEQRRADSVRSRFEDQRKVLALLDPDARSRVERLHRRLRASDADVDLVGAMSLPDLLDIASRDEQVRATLGVSKYDWIDRAEALRNLRNQVMHITKPLIADEVSLSSLLDIEAWLRRTLGDGSDAFDD